jgi:hypothetical protein
MLTRSVAYSQERTAFEKKISKFQAVQHNLAQTRRRDRGRRRGRRLRRRHAVRVRRSMRPTQRLPRSGTAAKIRCAEAAGTGAAIAHQVHGAIGFTDRACPAPLHACARSAGATISATKATGRSSLGNMLAPSAAPTSCGPSSPPAEPFHRPADRIRTPVSSALTFDPVQPPGSLPGAAAAKPARFSPRRSPRAPSIPPIRQQGP